MGRVFVAVGLCAGLVLSSGFAPAIAAPKPASVSSASADAPPSARALELTRRYLKATNTAELMAGVMDAMDFDDFLDEEIADDDNSAMKEAAREAAVAIVPELSELMAPKLAALFTEEELEAMVAFYESPVGQSVLAKTPALAQASVDAARELMPMLIEDMFKRYCTKRDCSEAMKSGLKDALGVNIS